MRKSLWNKNFTYSFIGTIISAIGGIGLNLGLSVYVYGQTKSTVLSGVFAALTMIPQFILPLIIGTYIDRVHPVKVMVKNEALLATFFVFSGLFLHFSGFNYGFLLIGGFIASSMGVVSQLCAESILPKLMESQNYNRGNSIMNMIYPLSNVAMTPVMMLLITRFGAPLLFVFYGLCCYVDAFIENKIDISFDFEKVEKSESPLAVFKKDMAAGLRYLQKNPSIRSIFFYFVVVMAANAVSQVLLYPHFSSIPALGDEKYAFLLSVNSAGYLAGGLFLYIFTIPPQKRYILSGCILVYFIVADALVFSLPFSLLLVTRFLAGFLGSQSANFRISAVQAMVPEQLRGKVNALYSVMINLSMFLSTSLIGFLGERISFTTIALGAAVCQAAAFLLFFLPPKNRVKDLYNYRLHDSLVQEDIV